MKSFFQKAWCALLGGIFLAVMATGCGSGEKQQSIEDELNKDYEREQEAGVTLSEDIVDELIHAIPSPVEMTALIRFSGADYNEEMLHTTDGAERYTTNYKKALNLGVYGADLGYINIYEKSSSSLEHFSVVKDLSNDLKVGQFFDFTTLRRLASSQAEMDSLIIITTQGFSKMDAYLREQKRGNISVLIAAGTWLEGMFIATQVAQQGGNAELIERIGEQKEVLDKIVKIVEVYKSDEDFNQLLNQLEELQGAYEGVTITRTYAEPTTREENGVLIIEDNSTSEIVVPDAAKEKITETVAYIRKQITG